MRLRRTPQIVALALVSMLAFATRAQPAPHDPDTQDTTTTDAGSPAPPLTPEQIALMERYLTNIRAQPVGKIDTRTATAGQTVTFEITRGAVLANGTQLPAGTRLIGRVLRAQPYAEGGAALLSIKIARAVLNNGTSISIRCMVRGLTVTEVSSSGLPDASQPGSRRRGGGGGPAVGGPTGGAVPLGNPTPMGGAIGGDTSSGDIGNSPGGSGSSYPNTDSTSSRSTASGGIPTGDPGIGGSGTRSPLPNTTAVPATADPQRPVTHAGVDIHDAPRSTGLPGVMLSGASITGASGNLSAYEHNFTLDSGTQLMLGVISR